MIDACKDLKVGRNVFLKHIMKMSPYNILGVGGSWGRPKVLLWLAAPAATTHKVKKKNPNRLIQQLGYNLQLKGDPSSHEAKIEGKAHVRSVATVFSAVSD